MNRRTPVEPRHGSVLTAANVSPDPGVLNGYRALVERLLSLSDAEFRAVRPDALDPVLVTIDRPDVRVVS